MAAKTLVACFSATGVTAKVAERLARAAGADLAAIEPAVPYTSADLDWRDETSRSTLEMRDASSRPELASRPDVSRYGAVLIGFPIWWYTAPAIIRTYLESADFTDKSIALFATSGSSPMGEAMSDLAGLAPDAWWLGARRFDAAVTEGELAGWLRELEL